MTVGAVILAAGAGARLGGVAKALEPIDGTTFLAAIVGAARAHDPRGPIVVVVGAPFADVVAPAARALGALVATNPVPARGMASSIACGFGALAAAADRAVIAAWLWPVDHPRVTAATLARLAAALPARDHAVVRPRFGGQGGHPPLVGRGRWDALAACGGAPEGARAVLRGEDTLDVEVDDPGVVRDVDTPADRAALERGA